MRFLTEYWPWIALVVAYVLFYTFNKEVREALGAGKGWHAGLFAIGALVFGLAFYGGILWVASWLIGETIDFFGVHRRIFKACCGFAIAGFLVWFLRVPKEKRDQRLHWMGVGTVVVLSFYAFYLVFGRLPDLRGGE